MLYVILFSLVVVLLTISGQDPLSFVIPVGIITLLLAENSRLHSRVYSLIRHIAEWENEYDELYWYADNEIVLRDRRIAELQKQIRELQGDAVNWSHHKAVKIKQGDERITPLMPEMFKGMTAIYDEAGYIIPAPKEPVVEKPAETKTEEKKIETNKPAEKKSDPIAKGKGGNYSNNTLVRDIPLSELPGLIRSLTNATKIDTGVLARLRKNGKTLGDAIEVYTIE